MMAITEFDLFRMQIAIDSSCYKSPQQRKKAQQQKAQQQLNTRRQAEYHVISQQFDTQAKKTFMDKYGQTDSSSSLNSYMGLDTKAIKNSVATQIDAKTQEQIDKITNTPAKQAFLQKYGQNSAQFNQNSVVNIDTQAQIDKITNTPAKQAFLEKYGQKNNTLQNDQVSLSQEALAKLIAEKFGSEQESTTQTPTPTEDNSTPKVSVSEDEQDA